MDKFAPDKAIIPIVKGRPDKKISELLGTGFFVSLDQALYVLTAKHVFEGSPLVNDEFYGYVFKAGEQIQVWSVPRWAVSRDYDVAAFESRPFDEAVPLPFSDAQPPLNGDVICYEYSHSRIETRVSGHTHVTFEPLAHKGNVMRIYESTFPETVPTPSFIVSFPALQGASGAPVVAHTKNKNFYVAGLMVANLERHLLPAQILRIEDSSGTEETIYFLPLGKAIDARVIKEFILGLGKEPDIVE
jgi:hypothetical protein